MKKSLVLLSLFAGLFAGNVEAYNNVNNPRIAGRVDVPAIFRMVYNVAGHPVNYEALKNRNFNFIMSNGETPLTFFLKNDVPNREEIIEALMVLNKDIVLYQRNNILTMNNHLGESPLQLLLNNHLGFDRKGIIEIVISQMKERGQLNTSIRLAYENGKSIFGRAFQELMDYVDGKIVSFSNDTYEEVAKFLA